MYLEVRLARSNVCEASRATRAEEKLAALVSNSHVDLQPTLGGELAQAVGTGVIVKLVNSRVGSLPWRTMSTSHSHQLNLRRNYVDEENWFLSNLLVATSTLFKHCRSSTD